MYYLQFTIGMALTMAFIMLITKAYTQLLLKSKFLRSVFDSIQELVCKLHARLKHKKVNT